MIRTGAFFRLIERLPLYGPRHKLFLRKIDREQRVHIRSVPSATLFRALVCGCLALAPAACAQTVASTQTETDPNAPKTEEALKTQCWMAQENKKNVNNLDAKIAAVDKCIADGKKHLPPAG
jgi:septal ring factor EnvC (AmiA/AmiB activator)